MSRLSNNYPHENRAVTPEDMLMLIRIADTEDWLQNGILTLDAPENHKPAKLFGSTKIGIVGKLFSRTFNNSLDDIKNWYKTKFSTQDQGLNINGQKNLTEAVLKDIAVLIGINDYRVLKNLDGDVVFDLVDQRLRYAINENIKSYDNEVSLENIDQNT